MGIIIGVIFICVFIALLSPSKKGDPPKHESKSPGKDYHAPKQEAKQTIDQKIVDRIMLLTSTAIQMADVVQQGRPHGAYIRVSAGDFGGKSWAEVQATVYNIRDSWSELDALTADKTHENAQRFLCAAGLQSINSNAFLQCVYAAKIEMRRSSGYFTLNYSPAIPYGTGQMYHAELERKLNERWPYLQFAHNQGDIDIDIA